MRVKCIANSLGSLGMEIVGSIQGIDVLRAVHADRPPLTIGREYVVYGISCHERNLRYDILCDAIPYCTIGVLAVFFEVVDPRPSRYWIWHQDTMGNFRFYPPSWISTPYYHDLLSDGDAQVSIDFRQVKELIDKEAHSVGDQQDAVSS